MIKLNLFCENSHDCGHNYLMIILIYEAHPCSCALYSLTVSTNSFTLPGSVSG